jgi:hypothetical protein
VRYNHKSIAVKLIDKILKAEAEAKRLSCGTLLDDNDIPNLEGRELVRACKKAGKCAIGALLVAAGYPVRDIIETSPRETYAASRAAKLLYKVYGLRPGEISEIETINDSSDDEDRYAEVIGFVEFLAWMRENRVTAYDDRLPGLGEYEDGFDVDGWDPDEPDGAPVDEQEDAVETEVTA